MKPLNELYRTVRQRHLLPVLQVCRRARHIHRAKRWAATVGFAWDNLIEPCHAQWAENGYCMDAYLEIDANGKDAIAFNGIGEFTTQWQPGAIAHGRPVDTDEVVWFVPDDPARAQKLYRQARRYDLYFQDLVLNVTASHAGDVIAGASLDGIGGDDDATIIGYVCDLADDAITEADQVITPTSV